MRTKGEATAAAASGRCVPPFVFASRGTERVFADYSFGIRQSLLTSLVGVFILLSAVFAILYFVHPMTITFDNMCYACMCGVFIVLYVFSNTKYLRGRRSVLAVSYTFWIVLALLGLVSLPVQELRTAVRHHFAPADGVWQCLLLVYAVYLTPTVHFYAALTFGAALPAAHFVAAVMLRDDYTQLRREASWKMLAANAILFLAANVMGIIAHVVCDRVRRSSFLSCRGYVTRRAEAQEHELNLERLLHTMLPPYIATELKANLMLDKASQVHRTYGRQHRYASVMSATVQGLDSLKRKLAPCDFVRVLSDLTTAFEQLCEKHRCMYIKASGDSFLAACGIPSISSESVRCCLELAFDVIQTVNLLKQAEEVSVVALVGVHTGCVVDGVVGGSTAGSRWRYECYGSDVLLARHLGVTSVNGKVHVSEPTLQQLQPAANEQQGGGGGSSSAMSSYDVQKSPISHGLNVASYFVSCKTQRPLNLVHQRFARKLNSGDGPPSTPRPSTAPPEGESAFSRIISRSLADDTCSVSSHKFMTSSLPEVVVPYSRRPASVAGQSSESGGSEQVNKVLSQAIAAGAVEQETSAHINFFTLKFKDSHTESAFFAEDRSIALGLVALLLVVVCSSAVHFIALPRTMVLLVGFLFLFMVLSLLLIAVLAMKLKIITCNAFHSSVTHSVLATLLLVLFCASSIVNVLTCKDCIVTMPSYLRYGVAEAEADVSCTPPHYIYLVALLVLFGVVNFRVSYILQLVLLVLAAAAFSVVIAFTNAAGFQAHDKLPLVGRDVGLSSSPSPAEASSATPSTTVLGLVGIIHFVLLHFLVGRHIEWVHRVDFVWKFKEQQESASVKDLRQSERSVVANMLPPHVIPYYAQAALCGGSSSLLPVNYSSEHHSVGVAVVTIPNFPNLMAEMEHVGQGLGVIQAIDEIEAFLDELLRRDEYQALERIHVCGPMYVIASGVRSDGLHRSLERCPTCQSQEQCGCLQTAVAAAIADDGHTQALSKLLEVVLDLRVRLQLVNEGTGRSLFMRAGVAVGDAVEGVVGNAYPQYNIWGAAVDDARKLEMTCKAGQIQVSKDVSLLMKHRFHFQQRGQGVLPAVTELSPHYLLGARLQPVASDSASMSSSLGHRQQGGFGGSGPRPQPRASGGPAVAAGGGDVVVTPTGQLQHGMPSSSSAAASSSRARTHSADSSVPSTGTPTGSVIRLEKKDSLCDSVGGGAQLRRLASAAAVTTSATTAPPLLTSSLGKSRPLSPELPAVHYSKNKAPPQAYGVAGALPATSRDSAAGGLAGTGAGRPTVFLTQANLTGSGTSAGGCTVAPPPPEAPCPAVTGASSAAVAMTPLPRLSDGVRTTPDRTSPPRAAGDEPDVMLKPTKVASIPKIANVISTSNAKQSMPLKQRLGSGSSAGAGPTSTPTTTVADTASVSSLHDRSSHSSTLRDDASLLLLPPPPPPLQPSDLAYFAAGEPLYHASEHTDEAALICRTGADAVARALLPQPPDVDSLASLSDVLPAEDSELKSRSLSSSGSSSSCSSSGGDLANIADAAIRDSSSMLSEEPAPLPPPAGDWSLPVAGARSVAAPATAKPLPPSLRLDDRYPSIIPHLHHHYFQQAQQPALAQYMNGATACDDIHRGPAVSHARIAPTRNHVADARRLPPVAPSTAVAWPPAAADVGGSFVAARQHGPFPDHNGGCRGGGAESDVSDDEQHPLMRLPWAAEHLQPSAVTSALDRRSADMCWPAASKFTSKLQRLHEARGRQNVRDLYSELESDAADCESVVSADETDFESDAASSSVAGGRAAAAWWGRSGGFRMQPPASGLGGAAGGQRSGLVGAAAMKPENGPTAAAAVAPGRPLSDAAASGSLRQSCSMECLPSDNEDAAAAVASLSRRVSRQLGQAPVGGGGGVSRRRHYVDDKGSVVSSCLGSELSRSDPYLSYDESEYDNCRPGLTSDEDLFAPYHPAVISQSDLNQLDIDFDKFRFSDAASIPDYISTLERRIRARQKQNVVTDV